MRSRWRQNPSYAKLGVFLLLGVGAGSLLGYIFMGTAHAMLQIRADQHFGQGTAVQPDRPLRLPPRKLSTSQQKEQVVQKTAQETALPLTITPELRQPGFPTQGSTIHTVITSNGSPYLNFQTRIMYGTYKLVQGMPGGEGLVAFTRILHRTVNDVLVKEVPSFRADPLTPLCDTWCEFPVSDRPNAVAQWLSAAQRNTSMIQAPWLLMLETDYVWMRPLAAPPAESASPSRAYHYGYINPMYHEEVMRRLYPPEKGPISDIPGSGPAPVLLRVQELIQITPDWERLTAAIEADPQSKEQLGWVREMYAFSVAAALSRISLDVLAHPSSPLMAQPPSDHTLGDAALTHYTWGTLIELDGQKVYEFDKRVYTAPEVATEPIKIPLPPAYDPRWRLHDGVPVSRDLYDLLVAELTQMNKAVDALPSLTASQRLS